MQNNKGNNFELSIDAQTGKGVYANLALITHSDCEFIIDLATMLPGLPKPQVSSRVIMTPKHAKRFLNAMLENVQRYEAQYGKIELEANSKIGRTIAPFNGGDA